MKKSLISLLVTVLMLLSLFPMGVFAATVGEELNGDYVAIVNTNPDASKTQSTGDIVFDNQASTSMVEKPAAFSAQEETLSLPVDDIIYDENDQSNTPKKGGRMAGGLFNSNITYTVGLEKTFYEGKTYVCIYDEGKKAYVWMEKSLKEEYDKFNKPGEDRVKDVGSEVANMYDSKPYAVLAELAGGESRLGSIMKDGSGKLSILIEKTSGSSGYYAGEDGITAIHINAVDPSSYNIGAYGKYDGLIVHETQHAIFRHLACNGQKELAHELSWINEGLAVAAMDYYWGGDDPTGWLGLINNNAAIRTGSSLMYSDYRNSSAQDYSMPYLFVRYLADQKDQGYSPSKMIQAFYNNQMSTKGSSEIYLNSVLKGAGLKDVNKQDLTLKKAFENFFVAVVAQENTGVHGFYDDPIVRKAVNDYPLYAGSSGQSTTLAG